MTKQEFLAFSLPYDLKISFYDDFRDCEFIEKIDGMYVDVYAIMSDSYDGNPDKCKILLRPLSDLTKEIEHKGEKFVPIGRIKESQHHLFLRDDITNPLEGLQFSEFRKLIEWHFDLADLISKGEAIDVNTLEINPYK